MTGFGVVLLALGVLAVLAATANGVVRTVLRMASQDLEASAQRLKGGRIIGVVERILIFGLAVVGEPTAAGLLTEYFLLGSLVSWAVALFPVVLFLP